MRVRFERVTKRFGAHDARATASRSTWNRRRVPRAARAVRLRQDDAARGCSPASSRSDAGEIWIGDRRVDRASSPRDRDVAMVFQNYALYPHLSVFDNIAFPLRTPPRRGRARSTAACARRRPASACADAARAAARAAVRRPAAARRPRPRHRPQPDGLSDGRTALEPRRAAPAADPHRARSASTASWARR